MSTYGLRLQTLHGCLATGVGKTHVSAALPLTDWMTNAVDPDLMHCAGTPASQCHEMTRRHQTPCLGVVPRLDIPTPATVADHLNPAVPIREFHRIPFVPRLFT